MAFAFAIEARQTVQVINTEGMMTLVDRFEKIPLAYFNVNIRFKNQKVTLYPTSQS